MPKPKLPDEQRKDLAIKVRFLKSEMKYIINQAKKRDCKTISKYIRMLVANDIQNNDFDYFKL